MQKKRIVQSRSVQTFTFNANLGIVLDVAELGRGDARVGGRLADVGQHQDVLADGDVVFGRQVDGAEAPLYVWHRRADGDAGQVGGAARHDFDLLRRDGEMRWYSADWQIK